MGYHHIINSDCLSVAAPEDIELAKSMPAEAREIYIRTKVAVDRGEYDEDGPCCWLDPETRECRFHEHRPMVCRRFKVGGKSCRRIRREAAWEALDRLLDMAGSEASGGHGQPRLRAIRRLAASPRLEAIRKLAAGDDQGQTVAVVPVVPAPDMTTAPVVGQTTQR
jgi:hypothetical protein